MNGHVCYITVTVLFEKEKDDRWTAECKKLGTATFGDSLEEARELIEEAIELHLNSFEKNGQIEQFLKENGITMINKKPRRNHSIKMDITVNPHIFVQPSVYRVRTYIET